MKKYVRFSSGEIDLIEDFDDIFDSNIKYGRSIVDLLEIDDLVRIKYLSEENKQVEKLFQVDFISDDRCLINLKNSYLEFIIKDNEFTNTELNPTITSIITKEKLKSIEYIIYEKENSLSDGFREMVNSLMDLYKMAYKEIKPEVYYIINNNITDLNYIDKVLDRLLNLPYDSCYLLFVKLCNYVAKFNKSFAIEYLDLYKDFYGEDEPKIKKKIK